MTSDSETSSIELEDGLIEGGVSFSLQSPPFSLSPDDDSPFYEKWLRSAADLSLLARIQKYDKTELKTFIAQKLFKVDGIVCDEQTRLVLIEKMLLQSREASTEEQERELLIKYGSEMVAWLLDRLLPSIADCGHLIDRATHEYSRLRSLDPLCTWMYGSPEHSSRVLRSIERVAASMAGKVGWSLLVEPGTLSCHLHEFLSEFSRLESFFGVNPLSAHEAAQSAFNANFMTKARSGILSCGDENRVLLQPMRDSQGRLSPDEQHFKRARLVDQLFENDGQIPEVADGSEIYGTSDFIHASYVRGGPLMNTFICTQAPLPQTQTDFWRMVWQERSELIIMLCGAVDSSNLGPLNNRLLSFCPFYWPRCEGESLRFGVLCVKNVRVDGTADPLFNVTHLEISRSDAPQEGKLKLQHWQWDWRQYSDPHWPLRVLRRARLSPSPTIVQCLDGCGRSGALVTLEVSLMQLIRGSPMPSQLVFVSSLFTRLQRRHSISTSIQYLFIYRTLIHWMEPLITSFPHRIALGISWLCPRSGFIPKYDKFVRDNTKISATS